MTLNNVNNFVSFLQALYGVLFLEHKEAAFANYRLWESVGFVIAFAYANFICIKIKLIILLIVLLTGMILYGVVEYLEYSKVRQEIDEKVHESGSETHTIISETKF